MYIKALNYLVVFSIFIAFGLNSANAISTSCCDKVGDIPCHDVPLERQADTEQCCIDASCTKCLNQITNLGEVSDLENPVKKDTPFNHYLLNFNSYLLYGLDRPPKHLV